MADGYRSCAVDGGCCGGGRRRGVRPGAYREYRQLRSARWLGFVRELTQTTIGFVWQLTQSTVSFVRRDGWVRSRDYPDYHWVRLADYPEHRWLRSARVPGFGPAPASEGARGARGACLYTRE